MRRRTPQRRRYRSQVVVMKLTNSIVEFMIMGRKLDERAIVKICDLPEEIIEVLAVDKILHAVTNLGARDVKDLVFSDWEPQ